MPKFAILAAMSMLIILLAGCLTPVTPPSNNTTLPPGNNTTGIPNPASQFCVQHNGTLQIKTGDEGAYAVCTFPNGAKCEEWAFFRGECSMESPNFCDADSGCGCGVHRETRECFYGQMEFVDPGQQCPDFCNGIAAHLEIKCIRNQCTQVQKDMCANFQPDDCPSGCAVCPPCAECSSIRCQKEAACEALGFGKDWYNTTVNPK